MDGSPKLGLALGLGLGGSLMYLFDPAKGKRRRVIARDRAKRIAHQVTRSMDRTMRDLANRTHGLAVETRSLWKHEIVPDWVLSARVHTALGRLVANAHELEVTVTKGIATLRGPVLEKEAAGLIAGVAAIPGVTRVENRLRSYRHSWDAPGLREARPHSRLQLLTGHWPPATRFLMGVTGGALALSGVLVAGKRGAVGATMAISGAGLLMRGVTSRKRAGGGWAVDVRKTLHLSVPVEEAFEFWTNYRNFPRFMAHLREVRDLGNGRSHWVAAGPAGASVEWDAEITRIEPNSAIAWQSVPGSSIDTGGEVHFHSSPDGTTRLDIRLCFNPPAGSVGHLVGSLLRADPRQAMNEDLRRLKSLLET